MAYKISVFEKRWRDIPRATRDRTKDKSSGYHAPAVCSRNFSTAFIEHLPARRKASNSDLQSSDCGTVTRTDENKLTSLCWVFSSFLEASTNPDGGPIFSHSGCPKIEQTWRLRNSIEISTIQYALASLKKKHHRSSTSDERHSRSASAWFKW